MKKKDWWDFPDNPIKGCNGPAGDGVHCPYCYAKRWVKRCNYAWKIAKKEIDYLMSKNIITIGNEDDYWMSIEALEHKILEFKPHFFEYVIAQPLRKKPTLYFFSMSDPADWEPSWHEKIVEKIRFYPQHRFAVLTKRPKIYEKYTFPNNIWLGVTCTTQEMIEKFERFILINNIHIYKKIFLSIEPIHEKIKIGKICGNIVDILDWIIVGPETGTKKKTPGEWLNPFFSLDTPVFMKTACSRITDRKLRQEWPEGWRM